MDWVSTPEVREAALRNELASLENSIERPAKGRRIEEVKEALAEFDNEADESAPAKKAAPAKKVGA